MRPLALAALVLVVALVPKGMGGTSGPFDFEDTTSAAGIHFRHAASVDRYTFPEVDGGGACVGDVNGDGIDDVFLANGEYANATLQALYDPRSALYLGNGDGTFTDASAAWGADVSGWNMGCTMADYDGDGRLDVLLVGYGTLTLLHNAGERFVDATAASGLTEDGKCGEGNYCFGTGSCWGDYDRDGRLDVYVTNYVDWNIDQGGPATPNLYNGEPNVLWHNNGNGTFTDVTAASGTADAPGPNHSKSFQCSWADYDRDGWPDLYVASDTTPNTLFHNQHDGTFTDVAVAAGVDDARASMGLTFDDANGDGLPDVYVANYQGEHSGYFVNRGDGTFRDASGTTGLADDTCCVHWGTGFFDFDQDGRKDLYSISGGTRMNGVDTHLSDERSMIWHREADGSFTNVTFTSGPAFEEVFTGRGAAALDADLDGALDLLVVGNFNQTARLWHNAGTHGHWLQVELRSPGWANERAIGAEVTVTPAGGGPQQMDVVRSGSSYLSGDSAIAHAGLGAATSASVTVRWPDGATQTWTGLQADMRVRLTEGNALAGLDTISPLTKILVNATPGDHGWLRSAAAVTLDARDRALGVASGVARSEIAADGAPLATYAGAILISGDGAHDVAARSIDGAGNVEPPRRLALHIDATPPTSASDVAGDLRASGWYRGAAMVRVRATDATSGVDHVEIRVDGGAWQQDAATLLERSGSHVVEYRSVDRAGNVEAARSTIVKVDRDAPTVTLPVVTTGAAAATIAANATDASSGVASVAFYVDGASAPAFMDEDGSDGWSFTLADPGAHTVRACATDAVGLMGCADSLAVVTG